MKTTRLEFIRSVFAGFLVLLSGNFTGCKDTSKKIGTKRDKKNPYEYNIDQFKNVAGHLIHYKEIKPIDIDVNNLKSIAIAEDDSFVAGGDKKIFIFSASGVLSGSFSVEQELYSLSVENKDTIYVAFKDHLQVYDSAGKIKQTWSSLGENAYITGIDVNKENVAVADYGNKQVWLYNKKGGLLRFIGLENKHRHGSGFKIPSPYFDVHFSDNGSLWVVNPGAHRLENYSLDGTLLSHWGKPSMNLDGFSGCCNPTHFAFLPNGDFITAEKGLVRIKIHNSRGGFKGVVAAPDAFAELLTGLDMAVNSKGNIYVTDRIKKHIRIFVKK